MSKKKRSKKRTKHTASAPFVILALFGVAIIYWIASTINSMPMEKRTTTNLSITKHYQGNLKECELIDFTCLGRGAMFYDALGCGCAAFTHMDEASGKSYVSTSTVQCSMIDLSCENEESFNDASGCGCMLPMPK